MSIFNNNKFDPFGTNSLFADINKTNQQINSMNLPAQPTPQEQDYKRQRYGNMMLALSDVLKGRDPSAGVMQRQALIEAQKKEAERKAAFDRQYNLLNENQKRMVDQQKVGINLPTATNNTTLERFGVYNIDGTDMGAVNKGDINEINRIKNDPNLVIGSLGSPKTTSNQNMNLYSITDGDGKRIRTIVNPTKADIDNINDSGYFINKLPTATDRGKGFDSGKPIEYKGWNDDDGLKSRYQATNTLINTGERLLNQLAENPNSILTAGDLAQYFERAKAEVGALGGRPENYTSHLKETQQTSIKDLAREAAVSESMLLDFTFQIAQARGQTGRGLSDKDFIIFQKIISAGLTADQKAAALVSFIDGIKAEVEDDLESEYNFYNKRLERDSNNKEAQTFVTGIEDLRSMPFKNVINPFAPTNTSQSEIDRLVQQYGN